MEERSKQDWESIFSLFKLEYEQAAERYENIYKAIWQIFSYMGILAAGILTFGSRNSTLPVNLTAFIALTPLVFWFLAIYIPMNRYGKDQGKHLADMENSINDISKDFLNPCWELKQYKRFNSRKEKPDSANTNSDPKETKPLWRVSNAVYIFGVIIVIAWVICIYQTFTDSTSKSASETIELKLEPVEVTMQEPQLKELQNKLESLSQQINSIDSLIRDKKANPS